MYRNCEKATFCRFWIYREQSAVHKSGACGVL